MKLEPISKGAGFNHAEAQKAYDWVMGNYDEALAVLPFALFEDVQNTIFDNRETIQKALDVALAPQFSAISKALGADPYARDPHGRFAAQESRRKKPIRYTQSAVKPERKPGYQGSLSGAQAHHFKAAYEQVADEVDAAIESGMDAADTFWTAAYRDRQGRAYIKSGVGLDPSRIVSEEQFKKGDRLVELGLTSKPNLSAGGAAYDLMTAMGNPTAAAQLGSGFGRFSEKVDEGLPQVVNGKGERDATRSDRLYNRLRSAGELATYVMGDHAPAKMKLAAATATWVGTHGPEAQKVLGPPTQRASYRYRGTEKRPDPRLQGAVDSAVRASKNQAKDGMGQAEINSRAREAVIYGHNRTLPGKRPGQASGTEFVESPLIRYFQERLPSPDLYRLQQSSGTIPPSQGVIIDRHGRVAHEAVGYGEDWYLPFNLKNLKALKGGEYVRTRAYGGLTTEDVYTGLVSGARSVTVVSNSGVFTLEFDDTFRGGRRLNDKAARMVSRYGFLLDAVDSGKVVLRGIDPSLRAEIEQDAARRFDPVERPAEYKTLRDNEIKRAELNPRLSRAQTDAIAAEVTDDAARDWAAEHGYDAKDLTDVQEHEAAAIRGRYVGTELEEMASQVAAQKWGTPEAAAATMGVDQRIERVKAIRLNEARKASSALSLNGEGYDYAGKALQEQFPYYVSRYSSRTLAGRTDRGYVKAGKNRPGGLGVKAAPKEPEGGGGAPAVPVPEEKAREERKPDLLEQINQRRAAVEVAEKVRRATVLGPEAVDGLGWQLKANRGAPLAQEFLDEHFGALRDPDFESKWASDPAFKIKALAEMRKAQDFKVFDVDFGPALGAAQKKLPTWSVEGVLGGAKDFDFGPDFAADAGGARPREHFLDLLSTDPDIRQVLRRNGLEPDNVTGLAAALPGLRKEREQALAAWAAQEHAYNRATPAGRLGMAAPTERDRDAIAEDLRGIDKALTALKHAHAAERGAAEAAAVQGEVVEPEVNRIVAASPQQAAAQAEAVAQGGGTPALKGPVADPKMQEWLRAAGLNPS